MFIFIKLMENIEFFPQYSNVLRCEVCMNVNVDICTQRARES